MLRILLLSCLALAAAKVSPKPSVAQAADKSPNAPAMSAAEISPQPKVQQIEVVRNPARDGFDKAVVYTNGTLAFAAMVTGFLTWRTLVAIRNQTTATNDATVTAKKMLAATLRPKLIVRKITMTKGTMVSTLGVEDARAWTVDFDIANVGQGIADIIDHAFFVHMGISGRVVPDSLALVGGAEPFELEPGEERRIRIAMPNDLMVMLRHIGDDGLAKGYQNTDSIYFFGIVKYADSLEIKRNTAVCRWYNNANLRFVAVDDPDREYAD